MTAFDLPSQTIVNKVIPKNAFDKHTNTRQKKRFSELVERIRWINKLSSETLNLAGKEITEIQVFEIELRKQEDIADILAVIDKAVPYLIIFRAFYNQKFYISTSIKHLHPTQEDVSVIDWTFKTDWQKNTKQIIAFDLKKSLDHVYQDICYQLSSKFSNANTISELVVFEQKVTQLRSSIDKIKLSIRRSAQFNRKVELNQELNKLEREFAVLTGQLK